jgi:hypothetical protein
VAGGKSDLVVDRGLGATATIGFEKKPGGATLGFFYVFDPIKKVIVLRIGCRDNLAFRMPHFDHIRLLSASHVPE